ncbi:GDP-mannose 4,6-dehydratase [Aquipuribacter nitratireducens]|uniref:GDP-mannose 4,6-dehydratase n=1 Tax=Aquipuribacter nitratireducens TaxID=650104 RepID=A0ABW0GK26_9MICO
MPRALVTGVTGQDGSYLAERLLAEGWAVDGLVRAGDTAGTLVPGVTVHHGDLAEPGLFRRLLPEASPDVVFHLGGLSSVARSWQDPGLTADVTGAATARLLGAAHALGASCPRVVVASSAEVFAGSGVVPQDESTPVSPTSPYGAAKAYTLHLARTYRAAGRFVSAAVLYNHESPRRPHTFVTRTITRGVASLVLEGGPALRLGNLAAVRDWGWAPDYVEAMHRMALADEPGDFVVATGRGHTVEDFVAAAFAAAGVHDWREHVETDPTLFRPVDGPALVGDATRAREVLGWTPTRGFDDVVRAMVEADLARVRSGPATP